jgi:hypothetical protein
MDVQYTPHELHCSGRKRKVKLLTNPAENEELHINKKYLSEKIAEELNVLRISQPTWVLPENKSKNENFNRFSRGSTIQATESAAVLPCSNSNFDGEMTIDTENSNSLPSNSENVDDIEDLHKSLIMNETIKKLLEKPRPEPFLEKLMAKKAADDYDASKAIILYRSPKVIVEEGIGLRKPQDENVNIDAEDLEMMTEDAQVVQTIDFDDGGSDTVGDVSAAPVVAQGYGYNTYGYPYPPQQYYNNNNNAMFYNVNNNNNNFVNTENNNFDSDTAMDEDINVL